MATVAGFFGFGSGGEDIKPPESKVELEAFQGKLRNMKILLMGPFKVGKSAPIIEAIQDIREPFRKMVLLTGAEMTLFSDIALSYDATFRIRTATDWSLALTYISHSCGAGPVLVISEALDVPEGFIRQISGKSITFLNLTRINVALSQKTLSLYDACFFPYLEDYSMSIVSTWYNIIQNLSVQRGLTVMSLAGLRDILSELRIAGAGLCWIRNGVHSGQNGNLHWYDPIKSWTEGLFELTKPQISQILQWVVAH